MIGRNNPLNIRTSAAFNWNGQTGSTRGFCDFESTELCRRAGAYLLMRSYRKAHCKTLSEIICRWAPHTENDTASYIHTVCKLTGFKASDVMSFDSDFAALLAAMEIVEQGVPQSKRDTFMATTKQSYVYLINHFNLKRYEG